MKKTQRMILEAGMVTVLSAILLTFVTYAWLSSMNRDKAIGLTITADARSDLVISDSFSSLMDAAYAQSSFVTKTTIQTLAPCTHSDGCLTNLKYVKNITEIDFFTGVKSNDGEDLIYEEARNQEDEKQYYLDEIVYIASTRKAMENVCLAARICSATEDGVTVTSGTLMAASVDFYILSDTLDKDGLKTYEYCGTLNVARKPNASLTFEVPQDTIPLNTEGYINIRMRIYFDGALEQKSGQAYVNTATVVLDDVTLALEFEAVAKS